MLALDIITQVIDTNIYIYLRHHRRAQGKDLVQGIFVCGADSMPTTGGHNKSESIIQTFFTCKDRESEADK